MKYNFSPKGVCATRIEFELDGDIVRNVHFTGGCDGNLKALAAMTEGMPADQVCEKLKGITCGRKNTSCSDQFARSLLDARSGKVTSDS